MSVVDGSVKWKKSHYLEAITYFEEDVVYIYAGHSKPSILEMILLLSTYYWIWACEKGDPGIFLLILTYCITIFCGLVVSFYYYCIPPMKVDARLLRASDPSLLLWIFVWFQRICFCRRFRERYYPVRSAYAPIQRQPKAPTVLPPKPPTPQTPRKRRAWGESMESKLPAPPVMPRENPGLSPRNAQPTDELASHSTTPTMTMVETVSQDDVIFLSNEPTNEASAHRIHPRMLKKTSRSNSQSS